MAADDSPLALALLSRLLRGAGYRVVTATNGIEAAQQAYGESPDLIVLDIEMPRMNGYHVCRLLKRDPAVALIPVIMLSAVEVRGTEFWSLQTGADAFVVKGADPVELLATVQALLARSPARASHAAISPPSAEDILASVSALMDEELYAATIGRIELKTILENLKDGVLTLNLAGEVTTANGALCGMLGQDEAELRSRPFAASLGEPAGPATLSAFEAVVSGRSTVEQESQIEHPWGHFTPVAIGAAPVRDYLGAVVGCVCIFHDITRRKEIEALYNQMQALDKVKNDLTHMIVHDLRTPLTSLMSGLQSLQPSEEDREILDISMSGGRTLLGMINNLLDISKMEEGLLSLEKTTFALEGLVNEALQQVSWLADDKELSMHVEISPGFDVHADADKLRRVLVNLLGNAVKFTPPKGRITVAAHREDGEIVVGVSDTGEGIPIEAFGRIFEKFEQVETRKAGKAMSSGLGLTFCKLVIEAHGGRIWVKSEEGHGSTFFFSLPQVSEGSPYL